MRKNSVAAFCLALMLTPAALAEDCGEPPLDRPQVPSGLTASPNEMRVAREAVIAYSEVVDEWLTCMDNRTSRLAQYMTREQRARMTEDLNNLHIERQKLQRSLNTAIREFRNAQRNG